MEHPEPPTTIKEIGIHLVYMSQKIFDLERLIKESQKTYATKEALSLLEGRVTSLENIKNLKNTLLWVGLVASAIINIIVIYQLFSGGK